MKTWTQISDSGFRGKINVVSPSDSAKRAKPGYRRAGFSHVNARWNPALLGVIYMSLASPVSRANSLNEVLITVTTDTQNDISKQNWLSLTV